MEIINFIQCKVSQLLKRVKRALDRRENSTSSEYLDKILIAK